MPISTRRNRSKTKVDKTVGKDFYGDDQVSSNGPMGVQTRTTALRRSESGNPKANAISISIPRNRMSKASSPDSVTA